MTPKFQEWVYGHQQRPVDVGLISYFIVVVEIFNFAGGLGYVFVYV